MFSEDKIFEIRDAFGFVTPEPPKSTQNGLLFTAYYYALLSRYRPLSAWEKNYLWDILSRSQIKAGLYQRSPWCDDQEAIDDYIGVVVLCELIGARDHARALLRFGETSYIDLGFTELPFYYNNAVPGTQLHKDGRKNRDAWLGRFPAWVYCVHQAACVSPGYGLTAAFAISSALNRTLGHRIGQDPIMQQTAVHIAFRGNAIERTLSDIWFRSGWWKPAFETYFKAGPIVELARGL